MNEATQLDRRAFLGFAAGGAAGLLLPSLVRPKAKVFDMGRAGPRVCRSPLLVRPVIFADVQRGLSVKWEYGHERSDGRIDWVPAFPGPTADSLGRPVQLAEESILSMYRSPVPAERYPLSMFAPASAYRR